MTYTYIYIYTGDFAPARFARQPLFFSLMSCIFSGFYSTIAFCDVKFYSTSRRISEYSCGSGKKSQYTLINGDFQTK